VKDSLVFLALARPNHINRELVDATVIGSRPALLVKAIDQVRGIRILLANNLASERIVISVAD
jgi:hypothetical protein